MYNKEINELIYKFSNLGLDNSSDGAMMIGKAPHKGPKGWLNIIYPKLNTEEINLLEKELDTVLPKDYKEFLMKYSNGGNFMSSTLSLDGLRRHMTRDPKANSRQPFSIITPNIHERPENAKDNYFFIGGYRWDGSHLYIDKETNLVHCCERWDATSKFQWKSFEEMLLSELKRLYQLFDDNGKEIDDDQSTLPY
ncbi:1,3-beta-glucan synthase regulator [Chryseobacterium angstadtii]|uniref:1,3-beta-glucan synthase regulator n=1 Tax=Chryseobacterium angstadtii TaxID=558151 RepID=A0A0J7HZT3_9FLAO|nr:SMI1/KNR4 family protein [Chryseobacterium angstadtii]KMQ59537.1 1,3-beta-glucan synthase regulator [Chryseobacterium angstadtii]